MEESQCTDSVGIFAVPSDPTDPTEGQLWYNTTEQCLKRQTNGKAVAVSASDTSIVPPWWRSFYTKSRPSAAHYHVDKSGFLHRCYHKCRSLFTWQFFAGITLSFPLEHALWTKVWPFYVVAEFFGLTLGHH